MSIIRCSESCVHQKDGYCDVDSVSNIVGNSTDPCIYYVPKAKNRNKKHDNNGIEK